ncbi:hypothetical protein L6R50_16765 [Myxococcota bacterium]|nr:hypothetical protein [Myxococcota bacterium]
MARGGLYLGKSGQFAVMAEFLIRGYNVAIPEVDIGEDVFVVNDDTGVLNRIQVKAANAQARARLGGYAAKFSFGWPQVATQRTPDLMYVLACRHKDRWCDYILMGRRTLFDLHTGYGVGYRVGEQILLRVTITPDDVRGNGKSLQVHREDWSRFPDLTSTRTADRIPAGPKVVTPEKTAVESSK